LDRSTLFPSTGLDTGIIIIRTVVPKHFVRYALTLQRRRGKSPLAMESINDRYCRSLRGVTP
jgi:hypothetical protein